MMRQSRPDVLDLIPGSRSRSRSQSISSDTAFSSSAPGSSMSAPLTGVAPEAAYIAASAATQIVTSDHESFFQTLCAEGIVKPGPPTIHVTPEALRLVNQFLDYLLWSVLSVGKSTTLKSLRPAVTEVLKSRLAREAITSAEAELEEYLGDAEEDDLEGKSAENEDFDIEKCWKKARLRCMIYSSLGDLEEDDEDAYSESDYPSSPSGNFLSSGQSTAVSPAVAIFLTSILEFIGEQTLLVAGHATVARFSQARIAAAAEEGPDGPFEAVDRPSVEELDMEKVALNPVLGRMWRQWKKMLRGTGLGQTTSRAPSLRRDSRRQSTISTMSIQSVLEAKAMENGKISPESRDLTAKTPDTERVSPVEELSTPTSTSKTLPLRRLASAEVLGSAPLTPIPETPRNLERNSITKLAVPEIEIEKTEALVDIPEFPRPNSMINLPSNTSPFIFPFNQPEEVNDVPDTIIQEETPERPQPKRARSKSLPLPGSFPFTPEEVDLSVGPWPMNKDDEDLSTPIPQAAPELPLVTDQRDIDEESIVETDGGTTDIDDEEADISTVGSIVETAEATATTPTFYKAQSVRIISSGTPPIGFHITERKSNSSINTEKGAAEEGDQEEREPNGTPTGRSSIDHAPEEIGIARTSDLFIAPVVLPTPVQSPVIGQTTQTTIVEEKVPTAGRRPSADSASDSGPSVRDIVKERRRRSKYYIPAPAPTAPDFYPEHHTQEEIAEHYKQQDPESEEYEENGLQIAEAHQQPPPIPPARKSPREELMELYGADPEFDEDQIPTKRHTIKPVRPLQRATSPLAPPAHSPGLQTSPSQHSDSSESLTTRSHSSGVLGADRRQYPSLDLPRPSSNRDIPTPTSAHGDRAGLRVWTPPATPDATKGRTMRSTSFSKPKGHGHSNSISSQTSQKLKTLITGRPTTADEKRQPATRHESDNDSAYSETQNSKVDEKERSFEQLINSGTTLQYTLTPDNVKRIDLEIASSRKGSADSGKGKNNAEKYVPIVTPPITQSAPRRSSSMKSRPLTTIAAEDYEDGVPQIPSKPPRSPRVGMPKSPNAENIKFFPPRSASASASTAPISQPPRGASLQPINTLNNSRQPQTPASPLQSPKSAVVGTVVRSPIPQQRAAANSLDEIRPLRSSTSKSRLVARAPQSATADSTLALIDFFRNTPPPLNGPSTMSRPVRTNPPPVTSPYRSTMDPKYNGASGTDSMSSINEKGTMSSYNSQADLIKKSEAPKPPVSRGSQRPQTDDGPQRKQVRIRDPYAIDSDDDDELFERPAPKPRKQEESLADFLKNVPPPEPSPSPSQQSFSQPVLKKKSSAAQLIGRFRSSSSKSNKVTKQAVSSPLEARSQSGLQNGTNGSTSSLPVRKHVPLPVKTPVDDQYAPRSSPSMGNGRREPMSPQPYGRKPIFQARDAKAHTADSDSSGLADFLRYTGPPVNVEPAMPAEKEETSRFKGMSFSSKKKRGIAV